jgi:hypothetical protein
MSDALAGTCAARLAGQRPLAAFGLLLSAGAWAGLGLWSMGHALHPVAAAALAAGAALAGLVERYLAVRVAIDAQLFAALAGTQAGAASIDLAALDEALSTLRMVPAQKQAQTQKSARALAARAEGAMRLVRWHTDAVALQALLLAAACIAAKVAA